MKQRQELPAAGVHGGGGGAGAGPRHGGPQGQYVVPACRGPSRGLLRDYGSSIYSTN